MVVLLIVENKWNQTKWIITFKSNAASDHLSSPTFAMNSPKSMNGNSV